MLRLIGFLSGFHFSFFDPHGYGYEEEVEEIKGKGYMYLFLFLYRFQGWFLGLCFKWSG